MVKIHRLKQPNKHSGFKMPPGSTTEICNIVITNRNVFDVYVDEFTRKPAKRKRGIKGKWARSPLKFKDSNKS